MKDTEAYHHIIAQLEDLYAYLEKTLSEIPWDHPDAVIFAHRRAISRAGDTYHDRELLEAYRREFVEYTEILKALKADVEFFQTGIRNIERHQ